MFNEIMQYVGFFTDNTNTFFHPYVEVKYDEYINDNRELFINGKSNNLYLYVNDDGMPTNLDTLPLCTINEEEVNVKQVTKGVYLANINASILNMDDDTILYDTWSKIALNGVKIDDIEMEFVVNGKNKRFNIGNNTEIKKNIVPSIYGINDYETLNRGEIREVTVDFREKYQTNKKILMESAYYRLYVKDGDREIDVINYQPIEKSFLNNFFIIYTEDLIPNKYFVDIKVNIGREIKYYKNILQFKIVSNVTNK
jgi:hypothetical protein